MADEIKSVRRNKKIAGIEDPIVIVQRLLNVYRQLHILDEKQREDFDKMVLQQPPEIRHMCATLPGGSLLQEYVDELEEKYGVAPDQNVGSEHLENSKDNILSNALASDTDDVVSQPTSAATSAENLDIQKQMLMMMQAMQNQAPNVSAGTTIKADSGFAKEIASAISGALAISDEKRRKETAELTKSLTESQMEMTKTLVEELEKRPSVSSPAPAVIGEGGIRVIDNTAEITKAITESQLEMAKMFLQHNAISASNSNANNANNIQINNAPLPNSQELIGDIIKAQSQLFREMAKEQTKELSTIISTALQESNRLSNKTLINTLTAFQKENMNFFRQQAKAQTVIYQQAPMQTESAVPATEPVYQYVPEEAINPSSSNEPSYIKKVFGNMFNRMHNQSEDGNASEAANEQTEYEYIEVPSEENTQFETSVTETQVTDNASVALDAREIETEQDDNSQGAQFSANEDVMPSISDDVLGLSDTFTAEKKKKKKKKKKKNSPIGEEVITQTSPLSTADREIRDLLDFGDDNYSNEAEETASSNGLDISLFASDLPEENKTDFVSLSSDDEVSTSVFSDNEVETETDSLLPEIEAEHPVADFTEEIGESSPIPVEQSFINLSDEKQEVESIETVNKDIWEEQTAQTEELIENNDNSAETNNVRQVQHSSLIPDLKDKEITENFFNSVNENNDSDTPLDLDADYKIALDTADESITKEDQDEWEWEYEEVPEDDTDNSIDAQADTENEDGEWEWEYEEVPEDDADNSINAQADTENEDGEWEWEYEEVSEDDADNSINAQADTENEDGEWEWEYEEVPEDDADNSINAQADTENEDGEWEWEYEEVSEESQNSDVLSSADNSNLQQNPDEEDLPVSAKINEAALDLSSTGSADFSNLLDNDNPQPDDLEISTMDPYSGDDHKFSDLELNIASLQSGDLYFQEEIPAQNNNNSFVPAPIPNTENEAVLPDWNEEENPNEPYGLNSDLKP